MKPQIREDLTYQDEGENVIGLEVEVSEWDIVSQGGQENACPLKVRDVIRMRRNRHQRKGMTNDNCRYL